jgi:hypothetical protein
MTGFKRIKMLIEVEAEVDERYVDHELYGIEATAQRCADIITSYKSTGAVSSKWLIVEEVNND